VISRPTVTASDLRVGDRLLVLRGEVEDVIPAMALVTDVVKDRGDHVAVSLAERPDKPLVLASDLRLTVERVTSTG